ERYTEKAEEALHSAKRVAEKFGQQEVDVEHLFLALLDQDDGLAVKALAKTGAAVDAVKIRVQREIERLPRVRGASSDRFYLSNRLSRLFSHAEEEAKRRKDDHVAEDLLLLAMMDDDGVSALILREFGATKEKLSAAIDAIRGNHR